MNIDVARLQQLVGPDIRVAWQGVVTSTNALLMDPDETNALVRAEKAAYFLLGADEQTAGRGRRQRPWISLAGRCATFSLRFPPFLMKEQAHLPCLPLALGVAVIDAIEQWATANQLTLNGALALKWPNDVLCSGKKVAGLLVEARKHVVAGVGINITLPQGFGKNESLATSALPQLGLSPGGLVPGGLLGDDTEVTPSMMEDLVARVACLMVLAQEHHRQFGLESVAQRWNALHAYQGLMVAMLEGGQEVCHGRVQGISATGELLLLGDHGQIDTIVSGDLSLRLKA
jgi:BirA family transcriptional regulator, biotin operon repressor / biotin---[acetyl-CoA-carboxylase] ligase